MDHRKSKIYATLTLSINNPRDYRLKYVLPAKYSLHPYPLVKVWHTNKSREIVSKSIDKRINKEIPIIKGKVLKPPLEGGVLRSGSSMKIENEVNAICNYKSSLK